MLQYATGNIIYKPESVKSIRVTFHCFRNLHGYSIQNSGVKEWKAFNWLFNILEDFKTSFRNLNIQIQNILFSFSFFVLHSIRLRYLNYFKP